MEYNQEPISSLEIGKKYTIIAVSDSFAFSSRCEFVLKEQKIEDYAQYKNVLSLIIQPKHKRKLFIIRVKDSTAIFENWDIALTLDSEQKETFGFGYTMRGNALLNIVGETEEEKEQIRQIFELNKNPSFNKSIVLMVGKGNGEG